MSERFSLDRQSFEQFLSAATVLQQLEKRCLPLTRDNTQPLAELVETQQAIEIGTLDLEPAIDRITELALKLTDARGAAVCLFTQAEFIYSGGAGTASKDHRLKMQVLSRLATTSRLSNDALCEPEDPHLADSEGNYPNVARSLLVAPVYQGRNIAGALAAFSDEPNAFLDQDTTNVRLLAGLIAHALDKDAERQLKQSVSVERATMLKVIEQLAPSLEKLALEQERERQRSTQPLSIELAEENPESAQDDANLPAELAAAQSVEEPADELLDEPGFALSGATPAVREIEKRVPQWVLDSSKKSCPESLPEVPAEITALDSPIQPAASLSATVPAAAQDAALAKLTTAAWFVEAEATPTNTSPASTVATSHKVQAVPVPAATDAAITPVADLQLAVRAEIPPPSQPAEQLTVSAAVEAAPPVESKPELVQNSQPAPVVASVRASAPEAQTRPSAIPIQFSAEFWNRRQQREHEMLDAFTLNASKRLRVAQSSMGQAVDNAKTKGRAVAKYRVNLLIHRNPSELRGLRRATGASLVLLIMLAFVILEIGMHTSFQTAAASSPVSSKTALSHPIGAGNTLHAELRTAVAKAPSGTNSPPPASALPTSHLRITDPDAAEEVAELSQYEVSRLFQQAANGDDWAAFQLGMAFETAQGLTQSCAKAAQWVTRAANLGNTAAEYNLGLRYRDGDGVHANAEEAQKWLAKAAKWKYPGAQAALAAVTAIPGQASAAQPGAQP
jgi:GAF domain/Sel1 repeat